MASVRVEGEAFSDIRYVELAEYASLADASHARGKMLELWRQCTLEQRHVLSETAVRSVLGNKGVEAILQSRLGVRAKDGIRIRGTKGRIEWLQKLRENGRKGGRPPKPRPKPEGKPSGFQELNPLTPALSPSPAPAVVQKKKRERDISLPSRAMPDDWGPKPAHAALATERGVDLAQEQARFRDWAAAKGRTYVNWDAGFSNWLRNARQMNGHNGHGPPPIRDRAKEIWDYAQRLRAEEAASDKG